MNLLDLLPWWGKALILAALVAAGAWAVHAYNEHLREEGRAEVQTKWDAERAKQTSTALAESQINAKETQRRLAAQKEAQDAHDKDLARARADAATATAAAGRLSVQLAAFTAAARRAGGNPAAIGDGPPANDALDLLADLFSRADSEAGILAEALDRSYAAGLQCERSYESLSQP